MAAEVTMIGRRGILGAMLAMPAIVRPGVLMPVKVPLMAPPLVMPFDFRPGIKRITDGYMALPPQWQELNEETLALALRQIRPFMIHFGQMLEVTYGD